MAKIASSFDPATEYLIRNLQLSVQQQSKSERLWLVDEHPINPGQLSLLKDRALVITNRFDQFQLTKNNHLSAHFSDFNFDSITSQDEVYIRIPKERALVHHLINSTFNILKPRGRLFLSGFKGEGIKTHLAKAEALFDHQAEVRREKNQLWLCTITKAAIENPPLDDQQYTDLRKIQINDIEFWTKPGLYGWNKIDRGSQLLADCLQSQARNTSRSRVLDLGCGYGYLSLRATELRPAFIAATDNCAAALAATQKNLENIKEAVIIPSDAGGEGVEGEFDLIVCNPPFHQGFSINPNLHPKFLHNTKRLLSKGGAAWYVVNQFVPLEKASREIGLNCREILREDGFKILKMTRL